MRPFPGIARQPPSFSLNPILLLGRSTWHSPNIHPRSRTLRDDKPRKFPPLETLSYPALYLVGRRAVHQLIG